jgi:hypothetical protein
VPDRVGATFAHMYVQREAPSTRRRAPPQYGAGTAPELRTTQASRVGRRS